MAKKRNNSKSHASSGPSLLLQQNNVTISPFKGSILDPSLLPNLERVSPNIANEIVAMAKDEQKHRHQIEVINAQAIVDDVKAERKEFARAQACAWSIAMALICVGGMLVYFDHWIAGSLLSGGTVIGVISTFLKLSTPKNKQ